MRLIVDSYIYIKKTGSLPLRRLLCNSLIQPHFDYACSAWYRNLNKRLKSKLQILQNKCRRFCLNLNSREYMGQIEFEQIIWLPVNDRFKQRIRSMSFKFSNSTSPLYMNGVFKPTGQPNNTTRASLLKLNQSLQKTVRTIFSVWFQSFGIGNLPKFLKNNR